MNIFKLTLAVLASIGCVFFAVCTIKGIGWMLIPYGVKDFLSTTVATCAVGGISYGLGALAYWLGALA